MALDARLHELLAADAPPFAAHVDLYGPCFQDFRIARTTGAPLLTLRGARDASNELVQRSIGEERLRMNSGRFFEGCLGVGYIVGRDDATHQDANAQLLRFLDAKLRH